MKNTIIKVVCTTIGLVSMLIGAMIADSKSPIPTIILMAVGLVLISPTIIGEIKREFT